MTKGVNFQPAKGGQFSTGVDSPKRTATRLCGRGRDHDGFGGRRRAPYGALAAIGETCESQMRVCSYRRASTGGDIASDLNGLLKAAKVPGPYLFVGRSAGAS